MLKFEVELKTYFFVVIYFNETFGDNFYIFEKHNILL
jgi:hypothetical protein